MHVLFSVHRYHPNHDGMVSGLTDAGHRVSFLVHRAFETEKYLEGVEVHQIEPATLSRLILGKGTISRKRRYRTFPSLGTIARILRLKPDVVVARDPTLTNYFIFLLCRLSGARFVLYVQSDDGFEHELAPGGPWHPAPLLLRLGLWPRHTMSTIMERPPFEVPGKTFDFIPFAIETYDYEKATYPASLPIRVLAVGKLDHADKRNLELVRTLAPQLRAGRARLTIAGLRAEEVTEVYRRLLDEIETQGVGDAVTVIENLSYDATRALYAEHDLFVMPNTREVAGIAPVEAMATGLPVIFTSDNGTNYFAEPGETGFIFEDGNFEDLRAKIDYFIGNVGEIERMGRRGREVILTRYTPRDFAQRFEALIDRRFPPRGGGAASAGGETRRSHP